MALKQAKVYLVTSVKGGSGKTLTTLNLAGLYSLQNKKVLIIDLDLYSGSIALLLNLDVKNDLFTIADDFNNNRFEHIEDYITEYNSNIDVLAAPKDPRTASKINIRYLSVIIAKAKMKYDVILIDTNHMLSDINLMAYDYSDYILYVIQNEFMTAKNMRTMLSIFGDMGKNNYRIILNNSLGRKNYFTEYDFKHMMDGNIDYTIPESFYIKNIEKLLLNSEIPLLNKKIYKNNKKTVNNLNKLMKSIELSEQEIKLKEKISKKR